ncbi:MAG TPA: hypothetical protein V6C85_30650 [Allocoleopsis sp.]
MIKVKEVLASILIGIPYSYLLLGGLYGLGDQPMGGIQLYPVIKRIKLLDNSGQFTKEVQHYISRGSSITRAKTIMELNGFECRFIENDTDYYQYRRLDIDKTIKSPHEGVDHLYCLLISSSADEITSKITRWVTDIEYKDRKVTDIYVSEG